MPGLLAAVAAFASALLLFAVEPLVAKQALPRFGGGPAVWTTCLVLFQLLLVGGYGWSEWGPRLLGARRHAALHALVGAVALFTLPPRLSATLASHLAARAPALAVLVTVGGAVALPFFVLSATTSLVSRGYAAATGRAPWFLYAASNLGSLVALVGYPLVERRLDLSTQARLFAGSFAGVVVLVLAAIAPLLRRREVGPAVGEPPVEGATLDAPPSLGLRARWLLRSATASLLLVAVSLRVSTDVSPSPLLWLVPLGLYLAGSIVAFWPRAPFPRRRLRRATELAACLALGLGPWWSAGPLWWVLALPLGLLGAASWLVHGDLAAERPAPSRLGAFYLAIAVGGALGGLGGGLVAPLVCRSVAEYPIAVALVALCAALVPAALDGEAANAPRDRGLPRRVVIGLAAYAAVILIGSRVAGASSSSSLHGAWGNAVPTVALLVALALSAWLPEQLALAATAMALGTTLGLYRDARVLEERRSFFGVLSVREDQGGQRRGLVHGTTMHGTQRFDPNPEPPSSYYHRAAPIGWVLTTRPDGARIGVIGLGTGAVAALARPSQSVTFFEIDPTVEPLARRWFTYLADARAPVRILDGDARATLADEATRGAPRYDLLLVDAFTSDAIPVHLLTVDALRLYLARTSDDGVVLLHISNRHLDLGPLLAAEAKRLGAFAAHYLYTPTLEQQREGAVPCRVVALTHDRKALAPYRLAGWTLLDAAEPVWTDERSSLLDVMRW